MIYTHYNMGCSLYLYFCQAPPKELYIFLWETRTTKILVNNPLFIFPESIIHFLDQIVKHTNVVITRPSCSFYFDAH